MGQLSLVVRDRVPIGCCTSSRVLYSDVDDSLGGAKFGTVHMDKINK